MKRLLLVAFAGLFSQYNALEHNACSEVYTAIKTGHFQLALETMKNCASLENVEHAIGEAKNKLSELTTKLNEAKSRPITPHIEPALQWAQSPDTVFINVKFAHKIDAPACIDLKNTEYHIEENRISVTAVCDKSQAGKHFKLDLVLFSEIDTENSTWALTSVGRGSFQLKKKIASKWERLLTTREKPKNLHLWWAMQEKFDDALEKLGKEAPLVDIKEREAPTTPEVLLLQKQFKTRKSGLTDAANKMNLEIEKEHAARKHQLKSELDAISTQETKKKQKVEEARNAQMVKLEEKLAQLQAANANSWEDDNGESSEDMFMKMFQHQLMTDTNEEMIKEEL